MTGRIYLAEDDLRGHRKRQCLHIAQPAFTDGDETGNLGSTKEAGRG